jgi:hypothetical protein
MMKASCNEKMGIPNGDKTILVTTPANPLVVSTLCIMMIDAEERPLDRQFSNFYF